MSLTTPVRTSVEPLELVLERLHSQDRRLDPQLRREIVAHGASAVPLLTELVEVDAREPQRSWASTHAVEILGELKATSAINAMLRLLAATEPLDAVHDALIGILGTLGAPTVEPALRLHAETQDPELRASLCSILAHVGVRDDRIFQALVELVRLNAEMGASDLAIYGDSRAIPHLSEALDACELEERPSLLGNQAFVELKTAIEDLGGELTGDPRARYDRAICVRIEWRRAMGAVVEGDGEDLVEPVLTREASPGRTTPAGAAARRSSRSATSASDTGDRSSPRTYGVASFSPGASSPLAFSRISRNLSGVTI